jgi:hypothetical protein
VFESNHRSASGENCGKKVFLVAPKKGFGKELLMNGMVSTINLLVKIPFVKLKKICIKSSLSGLVSTRRLNVLILSLQ